MKPNEWGNWSYERMRFVTPLANPWRQYEYHNGNRNRTTKLFRSISSFKLY